MDYRIATVGDLANVFRHNDPRMSDEYVTAGYSPRTVKDAFRQCISDGRGHTLLHESDPLALIVWQSTAAAVETGFAAKPAFFIRRYIRFCRHHIRLIQENNGNRPILAMSYGTHIDLAKWFAAIGFDKGSVFGGATEYILSPPKRS